VQKRTSSTLSSILLDDKSDEVIQRNALRLLLDLLPAFPKKEEDQKAIMASLDTLLERRSATVSVKMMIESARRNITQLRAAAEVIDVAEDGEVQDVPDSHQSHFGNPGTTAHSGYGSGSNKRMRDHSDGQRAHARPRVDASALRQGPYSRQFGGQRGT
jgi:hypothetical protein